MSSRMKNLPVHYFLENTPPLEKPYPGSIPPYMRLSNKVLTLIFYYVLRDNQMFITTLPTCGGLQMKIVLSQLSRRFRYLILRNPTFWSAFRLTTGEVRKTKSLLSLTRRFMRRCHAHFMQLHIEAFYRGGKVITFGGGYIDIVSNIVLPFRDRLWYLQCPLSSDLMDSRFFTQTPSTDFPYLEALDVTLLGNRLLRGSIHQQMQSFCVLANIPTLRFLRLSSQNGVDPYNLQITWSTLYFLELEGTFLSYNHFQLILANCHHLVTGIFEVQISPGDKTDIKSFGRLLHPNLRDLTLTLLKPSNDGRLFDLVFFPQRPDPNDQSHQFWFPLISFPFLHSLTLRLHNKSDKWNYKLISRFIQLSANGLHLRICRLQDASDEYPGSQHGQKRPVACRQLPISSTDLVYLDKVIPRVQELQLPNSTPLSRSLMSRLGTGDLFRHAQVIMAAGVCPFDAWKMVDRRNLVALSRVHVGVEPLRHFRLAVSHIYKDSFLLREWVDNDRVSIEYIH